MHIFSFIGMNTFFSATFSSTTITIYLVFAIDITSIITEKRYQFRWLYVKSCPMQSCWSTLSLTQNLWRYMHIMEKSKGSYLHYLERIWYLLRNPTPLVGIDYDCFVLERWTMILGWYTSSVIAISCVWVYICIYVCVLWAYLHIFVYVAWRYCD